MTDEDKKFLIATVNDLVEIHWLAAKILLRLQNRMETEWIKEEE